MPGRMVYWHEGMFLRPQHFQAAERQARADLRASEEWFHPFGWGFRSIDLDRDAIGNFLAVLRSCEARFRDGTRVVIPHDADLDPVDLKPVLTATGEATLYLAIPALQRGRANVEARPTADGPRYWVDTVEYEDENTGADEQPIDVRRLRARLLISGQDQTGYEVLPLGRVVRSSHTEAPPQLDLTFVPPLLAVDGWPPLWRRLQALHYQVGATIEQLAGLVADRGVTFESQVPGDAETLLKLATLNGVFSHLESIGYLRGLHPLMLYAELCRTAGQLAIFTDARRPPNMPGYDHDAPGMPFRTVMSYIDQAMKSFPRAPFHKRYFERAGERLEVSLDPGWTNADKALYLGVETELSQQACLELMDKLDMKLGSGAKVEHYYRQRVQGLRVEPVGRPPRALPASAGLLYFQINREAAAWRDVSESNTLGIRMNMAQATFQSDRILSLAMPGSERTTNLQFALFVV
ncbi:type VI secretion system baseplate subunit TssK [Tautonia plasticadhaerens]|uniref:Type VI secretion system baseplate subunit TssK n=1 Tax=Tautonia plasticadhaerens TaxID=2527974 RepID=A0A518GW27_9BACT|nr:type VI secretion system baseplate subunit TssK [Tautonia plasticadhaerens]QDV32778.1 hypothetical protein ElP_06180 [Tautonia plasticadhaerens]